MARQGEWEDQGRLEAAKLKQGQLQGVLNGKTKLASFQKPNKSLQQEKPAELLLVELPSGICV